jgi:hypothetical protein
VVQVDFHFLPVFVVENSGLLAFGREVLGGGGEMGLLVAVAVEVDCG